jgi:serine/threonine protein kinase
MIIRCMYKFKVFSLIQSDIWAMGVCIYEMSTLERPFDAMLMQQLVFKIVHGEVMFGS